MTCIKEPKGKGWFYILANQCFRHLKIGYTTNAPEDRRRQLSNLPSTPLPFELIFSAYLANPRYVERKIHEHFKSKWFGREFYDVTQEEVVAYV